MRKLIIAVSVAVVLLAGVSLNAHYTGANGEVNVERKVLGNGIQLTITSDDDQTAEELKKTDPADCPYLKGEKYGMHHGRDHNNNSDCYGYGRGRSEDHHRSHMGH